MKIFAKGFNFNQDGPGNRLVYHLSGCNMRCIWCSNPEGINGLKGEEVSVDMIVKEVLSSKLMFFSGGGVTFTGGEATIQHQELLAVLKELKAHDIHTAIETNGTSKNLDELCDYIDYLIMDFKHYDDEMLQKFTNHRIKEIKDNFEKNCSKGRYQHIRIPLINGINTDNPEGFAQYFSQFDTTKIVFEFLPYHEYGKGKWETEYQVKDGFISQKTLSKFISCFKSYNLKVVTT